MRRLLRQFSLPSLILLAPTASAHAQDYYFFKIECNGGLRDAEGVIGMKHSYDFNANCVLWQMRRPDDTDEMKALLKAGETAWHHKALVVIKTRAKGTWDRASGAASETMAFMEPVAGNVIRKGTCTKDPFLEAQGCTISVSQQSVSAAPYLDRLITALNDHSFFFFANSVDLAEAQVLSAGGKPANPPPPPPAPEARGAPIVESIAARFLMIGRTDHVLRVSLRGGQPMTARLFQGRRPARTIVLEDLQPGPGLRTAALRIPAAAVAAPGVLTIKLENRDGAARVELLACVRGGTANPEGCPVRATVPSATPMTAGQPTIPQTGSSSTVRRVAP